MRRAIDIVYRIAKWMMVSLALFLVAVVAEFERSLKYEFRFASPDGRATVVLDERSSFGDASYKVTLRQGW